MRKLLTIPNGVDLSRFTLTRAEARSRLSLPPDAPLVLFLGRMVRQKAVDLIPGIALRVRASVPNVRFLLAGVGPLESLVRSECRRLGISDSVELLGRRDDVPVLLTAADVLMLPSRYEGLANVVLEAQAARTPAVVTDVEGTRELVESGRTGVVVPPARPDLFADAIVSLLRDPDRRHSIADAARERVGESYTMDRMVSTNCALYDRLLSRLPDKC
jgi:glycosyltransferase involved in cell wall biosynthesis